MPQNGDGVEVGVQPWKSGEVTEREGDGGGWKQHHLTETSERNKIQRKERGASE